MQLSTIQDRIKNLEERIAKKEKTFTNKSKLLNKKKQAIVDAEFDLNDRESARQNTQIFWLFFDIDNLEDDLKRLPKEIDELNKSLEEYKSQLINVVSVENKYIDEVPECLKALEKELIDKWTEFNIKRRDQIRSDKSQPNWNELLRRYSKYERQQLVHKTDSEILSDNKKDVKSFVINLYNRIKDITGDVLDWSDVRLTQGARGSAALNGIITGVKGKCKVESIYAEGPVQRLHVRVLTKEIN